MSTYNAWKLGHRLRFGFSVLKINIISKNGTGFGGKSNNGGKQNNWNYTALTPFRLGVTLGQSQ